MTFHDTRFPTRISYGATGGPRFSTTVQALNSGHEQRNINWSQARREYQVDISPSRGAEWEELLNFFHARRGRAYGFRLKDFADFKLDNGLIAVGDGVEKSFKIKKIYTNDDVSLWKYERPLSKIVAGSISVFLDGAEQLSGWSVDDNSGLVTFVSAPANDANITVTCEFDVPVRFDSDLMAASIPGPDIHHWQSINLVEIRL